jgi:hypothetical protein
MITAYQILRLKKVFLFNKNLLFLIKEKFEIQIENDDIIEVLLPVNEKIRNWNEFIPLNGLERLVLLTKDKKEVL